MVASKAAVDKMVKILLKYVDWDTAHRLARDLYAHVQGSQSVTDTFRRIAECLEEMEEE
jgi:superfamily II RNA helicase